MIGKIILAKLHVNMFEPENFSILCIIIRYHMFTVDKKSESSIISSSAGREAPDKAPELTDSPLHHSTATPLEILDTSYVRISLEKR